MSIPLKKADLRIKDSDGNYNSAIDIFQRKPTYQELQEILSPIWQRALDNTPANASNIAETYIPGKLYKRGDYVFYNNKLHVCVVTQTTSSSFVASQWQQQTISTGFRNLKDGFDKDSVNLLTFYQKRVNTTHQDVTFTWNYDKSECTATGTGSGSNSYSAQYLFYNRDSMPQNFQPGQTYYVTADSTSNNLFLGFYCYGEKNQQGQYPLLAVRNYPEINSTYFGSFKIPEGTKGMGIYVGVRYGTTVNNDKISNMSVRKYKIRNALRWLQSTKDVELTVTSLLACPTNIYFTMNGSTLFSKAPDFPFSLTDSNSYQVKIYNYGYSSARIIEIYHPAQLKYYIGYTSRNNLNSITWKDVRQTCIDDVISSIMHNTIALQFNSARSYNIGNYVMYNNEIYKCDIPVSSGQQWENVSENFTQINISNEISNLTSAFYNEIETLYGNGYSLKPYWITTSSSQNEWIYPETGSHIMIPVYAGAKVQITSNTANKTFLAVLREYMNPRLNQIPPFSKVTGFTQRIQQVSSTTQVYEMPEDAKYLYVGYAIDNVNYFPNSIKIDGINVLKGFKNRIKDEINNNLEMINSAIGGINNNNLFSYKNLENGIINGQGVITRGGNPSNYTTDYIPIQQNTGYIVYTIENGLYSNIVIAFYDSNKTFIDRLVYSNGNQTNQFTTPQNCAFIRITSPSAGFADNIYITKQQLVIPFSYDQQSNSTDSGLKAEITKLSTYTFGLEQMYDKIKLPYTINKADNRWGGSSNFTHFMIPIKPGDQIDISTRHDATSVYAILKDAWFKFGEMPHFVYKYEYDEEDEEYKIVTDGFGQPILDTRRVLSTNSGTSFIAPPESAYLFILAKYKEDNKIVNVIPNVKINGKKLFIQKVQERNKPNYTTIFFDDFNTLNTNIWSFHTEDVPELKNNKVSGSSYISRFYTDENNVWAENSMLVMKIEKRTGIGGNGVYITGYDNGTPITAPRPYLAPYISTACSFAMPSGRISARIKTSGNVSKNFFPWAFWTFGQNQHHPIAHEMDIIESIHYVYDENKVTTQRIIPENSINAYLRSGIWGANGNGKRVGWPVVYEESKLSLYDKDNVTYGEEIILSNKFENLASEWHVYSVEWDKEAAYIYIDDQLVLTEYANEMKPASEDMQNNDMDIGARDAEGNIGFFYPQDIRFNIKAKTTQSGDEGYLFVDWVKAETLQTNPCTSIEYEDVTISVLEEKIINPIFPEQCGNQAFNMSSSNANIVKIKKYANEITFTAINEIVGVAAGEADITMTAANGRITGTFHVTVE